MGHTAKHDGSTLQGHKTQLAHGQAQAKALVDAAQAQAQVHEDAAQTQAQTEAGLAQAQAIVGSPEVQFEGSPTAGPNAKGVLRRPSPQPWLGRPNWGSQPWWAQHDTGSQCVARSQSAATAHRPQRGIMCHGHVHFYHYEHILMHNYHVSMIFVHSSLYSTHVLNLYLISFDYV